MCPPSPRSHATLTAPSVLLSANSAAVVDFVNQGPRAQSAGFEVRILHFRASRVACCDQSSRIVSRLAKHGADGTRLATRRVSDQQPASQPARLTDGRADIHPGRGLITRVCLRLPHMASLILAPAHTHTTPNKPRYMHRFLLQYQACCRRSSGAAPNFTPATDPFLPVSHMPPVAPICSPTGPTNRR